MRFIRDVIINKIITLYTFLLASFTCITLSGLNSDSGRKFCVFTILRCNNKAA